MYFTQSSTTVMNQIRPECTTEGPISELFRAARVSQINNNPTYAVVRSAKLVIRESPIFPYKEHTVIMGTQHKGL